MNAQIKCKHCGKDRTPCKRGKNIIGICIPCDNKKQAENRRNNRLQSLLYQVKHRANQNGWEFDLDQHKEALKKRYDRMVCEISGVAMRNDKPCLVNSITIDRKDSKRGYTIDNVRFICYCLNLSISNWGEEETRKIFKAWTNARS